MLLAEAIRGIDPEAKFEGIGSRRMRAAGFTLWRDHTGWASMGPAAAIPRIPKLLAAMLLTASHIAKTKPDLVVLVDFGVFNLRLAKQLRRIGYRGADRRRLSSRNVARQRREGADRQQRGLSRHGFRAPVRVLPKFRLPHRLFRTSAREPLRDASAASSAAARRRTGGDASRQPQRRAAPPPSGDDRGVSRAARAAAAAARRLRRRRRSRAA